MPRTNVNCTSFWKKPGLYMLLNRPAADYIDAFDPDFNIEARCKVTTKWSEAESNETKLEKIITPKWLAMYPEGCEAWAEQRRTCYPRLFPVLYNNSPGNCIDTEITMLAPADGRIPERTFDNRLAS